MRVMAVALALACACANTRTAEPEGRPPTSAPASSPSDAAGAEGVPATRSPSPRPRDAAVASDRSGPLAQHGQVVVVVADDWTSTRAQLRRYQRSGPAWIADDGWIPVVLGPGGLGWGIGLHGHAPESGPSKVEGDGRSPAGLFALGGALGYAPDAPAGLRVPYRALTADDRCVDDSRSPHYNRMVGSEAHGSFESAEVMRRTDDLYRWLVLVDHNHLLGPEPARPGAGSCIFLHVWRSSGSPTAGCTAMAEADLLALMTWLDPDQAPALVALPRASYGRLTDRWGLPALD